MRFTRQTTDPETGATVKEGTLEYAHVALRDLESRVKVIYDNELALDDAVSALLSREKVIYDNELALDEALSALLEAVEGMAGETKIGPPNVPASLHRARVALEKVIW